MGRPVKVETAAEIIAKKMYHRGDRVTARDLFDLSLVIERAPDELMQAAAFLVRHREAFLAQIRRPGQGLLARFEAIAGLAYQPSFQRCVEVSAPFLEALPSAPD